MATQLKLRRGTTAQHSAFTGASGEVTVDTTKKTLVVHDGSTAGGVPLAKENQLTAPSISFQQSGTGSATRTVDAKLKDLVSVKDFGAVGDGTTNDTAAFTAALASGRSVYVPKGNYKITANIVVPDGCTMFGDGPQQSRIKCDTNTFTGVFIRVSGRTTVKDIAVEGTGAAAGTGIRVSDANEYGFTGHIKIKNVWVSGFTYGVDVNNIFNLKFEECEITYNTNGVRVLPSYNGVGDNGYFTTITFDKCYLGFNTGYGFYANPTLTSKILSFHDCAIEGNNSGSAQAYYIRTGTVEFDNCYFELNPSAPAVRGEDSTTVIRNSYFNGTGGFSSEATSGQCTIINCGGTSSTDAIKATGTLVLDVTGSSFQTVNFSANVRRRFVNSTLGGTTYREYNYANELAVTDHPSANTSNIKAFWAYKRTVSATIPAGSTALLIADAYVDGIWDSDCVAVASLANVYQPGLLLTVTPATTGSIAYLNVVARNLTGSSITLTNALLKVLIIKANAMAI
jgi:hypothetical protein